MIAHIKNLIIDMDGVLWHGGTPLPGMVELFATLRELEIGFVLATNNASRTPAQYQEKLSRFGVSIEPHHILTSAEATGQYLSRQYAPETAVYVVGDTGLTEAMSRRGFRLLTVEDVLAGKTAACVVVGFTRRLTYEMLAAGSLLVHRGAEFVGANPDVTFPSEYGPIPGAGALLAMIQAATGVTPTVIGKPGPAIFREALERLGSATADTAMVGDRLNTDIAGGQNVGLHTILLLSGIAQREDLAHSSVQPDYVFNDIQELTYALREGREKP